MTKLNVTTYNTVAANTVADAVIDAPSILAWRQNIKDVVDGNSPDGQYAADAGSTDAYAVTLSPVPSAYYTGMVVRFKANTANTGAATINVNSLGAKTIKKSAGSDLGTGDILANQIIELIYDGTNFQLLSVPSNLANKTQEAWITPTLLNSWVNFGPPYAVAAYMKDELGFVHIKGVIKSGLTATSTVIFTLPVGYRPLEDHMDYTLSFDGTSYFVSRLDVKLTGSLTIISPPSVGSNFLNINLKPFRAEQ